MRDIGALQTLPGTSVVLTAAAVTRFAIPALRTAERAGDEELRAQARIAIAKIRPEYAAPAPPR